MRGAIQTSRVWGAAAGTALLLTMSACSGEADADPTGPSFVPVPSTTEPDPSDPSSPDPTTAPTATAEALVAPELPPAATEETPEGAAAFAEWWFETLNYASATGDTAALNSSTQVATCVSCTNYIEDIEDTYSNGGRYAGSEISAQVDRPSVVDDRVATFPVRLEVAAGSIEEADGTVQELPAESLVLVAATVWVDDRWKLGDLRQ